MKIKKNLLNIKNPVTGEWEQYAGIKGESAYEIAKKYGFQGTEEEFAKAQIFENKEILDQITQENIDLWNEGGNIDLTDYATKDYVDEAITDVDVTEQLKDYATKEYVDEAIDDVDVTEQLKDYAKKTEVPTKVSQLENDKGYLTEHQDLSTYAKKTDLHSHSNKSILDGITSDKITAWNSKSDFSGNYNDLTNKPTIPTVTNDLTNALKSNYDSAYTHSTSSHAPSNAQKNSDITKAEIEAKLTGNIASHSHNYLTSIPSEYVTDEELNAKGYATQSYVQSEIAKVDTTVDIVDSVDDMTDTAKQYVHSGTNTWWKYQTTTVKKGEVNPLVTNMMKDANTEVYLNKRANSSASDTSTLADAPGMAVILIRPTAEQQSMIQSVNPCWLRMKGVSFAYMVATNNSAKLNYIESAGGSKLKQSLSPISQIITYYEETTGMNTRVVNTDTRLYDREPQGFKLGYLNTTATNDSTNTYRTTDLPYIKNGIVLSVFVDLDSADAITEDDLKDVIITINEPILASEDIAVSEWVDTGVSYSAGDTADTAELKAKVYSLEVMSSYFEDVDDYLEDMDEYLEARINGGVVSPLPQYWLTCLNSLHDKIETLQMENGVDTFQFLWCSDIHGVPGTSPSNTTYIGEIGRYMMDKYNIPFFVASGDIMSQASHTNTANIWAEYDKLNDMLTPIKNEEFLAIRGNHDGVWGSPTTYYGQSNQYYHSFIGHKALYNAFMRRQSLDSYRRVFGHDGSYFYVDYHNYRIYMLNTHTFGDDSANEQGQAVYNGFKYPVIGTKQMQWIADTLNTVKENQQVIFIAHAPLNQEGDHTVFRSMLNSYINRGKGTHTVALSNTYWGTDAEYANTTITVDFTNAKGSILGWFNGHIHNDTVNTSAYSMLPMFSITTAGGDVRDSYYTNGTLTRTKGKATETAIDLVTITSDYIYFTRIGSGYDRVYNRATKEVTIDTNSAYVPPTNESGGNTGSDLVKPTKPSKPDVTITPTPPSGGDSGGTTPDTPSIGDGSIPTNLISTDTSTYTINKKYSGTDIVDGNGYYLTEVIPVDLAKQPYIHIKGLFISGDLNIPQIYKIGFYYADGTIGIVEYTNNLGFVGNNNKAEQTLQLPSTYHKYAGIQLLIMAVSDGNDKAMTTSDIKIDGSISVVLSNSSTFVSGDDINSGGSTPDTPTDSGEITSQITWQKDNRLSSSSGGYSAQTNCSASSDITVSKGDIIRIYNINWKNYPYITGYKNETFLQTTVDMSNTATYNNNYYTVTKEDTVTTITIIHDNITSIRICNSTEGLTNARIFKNAELSDTGGDTPSIGDGSTPTNLISTDTSTYLINKKYSSTSIVDGDGYYLTKVIPVDFTKQQYLSIEGLLVAGDGSFPVLYKIGFYTGNTVGKVEYTNNLGFKQANKKAKQTIQIPSEYHTYDGIQLLIYIQDSAITTSNIIIDGSISVVLSSTE